MHDTDDGHAHEAGPSSPDPPPAELSSDGPSTPGTATSSTSPGSPSAVTPPTVTPPPLPIRPPGVTTRRMPGIHRSKQRIDVTVAWNTSRTTDLGHTEPRTHHDAMTCAH
jgi:hypothetical protein